MSEIGITRNHPIPLSKRKRMILEAWLIDGQTNGRTDRDAMTQ